MNKSNLFVGILLISLIALGRGGILNKTEPFEQLKNDTNIELAIYLDEELANTFPQKDIGYYLDLEKSVCTNGAIIQFDTETWSPVIKNMSEYKTRCELYFGSEYKETVLNGMDPVLEEPLIPVTIDNDGVVKKASLANEWYSYEKKNWANAVILFDENETYEDGEVIPEEAIESYFVWIPKYRYQLWDLGQYDSLTEIDESKVHEIPIIFGDYNTSDSVDGECTTPMGSGETGNCAVGDYMTHPAFLSIPSTGFWVGKFETGYNGATSTAAAEQNVNDSSKIIVKPNTYSWRGIQVANAFYSSYDYQRNLDSHMMKNTEWGAVAYLQHSAYGSTKSVRINNNSSYLTGYAANAEPTCGYTGTNEECNQYCNDGTCNTAYPNSTLASTTENISGIYDMSGGANEYMMSVLASQSGNPVSGRNNMYNSGFNGPFGCPTCDNDSSGLTELTEGYDFPDSKYYDIYSYATSNQQYQRRILGDATGEMGPFNNTTYLEQSRQSISWYSDQAYLVSFSWPWVIRSATHYFGLHSGIYAFDAIYGFQYAWISFRIVLTPGN